LPTGADGPPGTNPNARNTCTGEGSDAGIWIRFDGTNPAIGVLAKPSVAVVRAGGAEEAPTGEFTGSVAGLPGSLSDSAGSLLMELAIPARMELVTPDDLLPAAGRLAAAGVSELAELGDGFPIEGPLATPDFDVCRPVWPPADELLDEVSPARLLVDVVPVPEVVSACANPEPVAKAAPTPRLSAPTPSQE
jgi:hypothetical protein